jgi:hypothetical protein
LPSVSTPRLVFEDERTLTLQWSRLEFPVHFDVCNLGAGGITAEATLVGFDFKRSERPVGTRAVLRLTPRTLTLRPRTCLTLTLERATTTPEAGEYAGVVIVRSTPTVGEASLIRRELTVTLPSDAELKPLKAAAEEIVLTARRWGPLPGLRDLRLSGNESLPLAVRGTSTAAPAPSPGAVIGVLQRGKHRAEIIVAGEVAEENGVPVLPIKIEAHSPTGTYSGTVDLATGDAEPSSVTVKVEASDYPVWALAAVLAGVGAAALLTWVVQKWLPRRDLQDRCEALIDRYRRAKAAFDSTYGAAVFRDYRPDEAKVGAYQETVDLSIKRWSKDNLLVDRERDDFKKVVRMLQDAEADADLFGDADGFGAALTRLAAARDAFEVEFPNTEPKFMRHAVDRLTGKPLPVGGATEIHAEVNGYVALASEWTDLARTLKRLDRWVELLRAKPLGDDEERVDEAAERVEEGRRELLDAADAGELERTHVARELSGVYARLTGPGVRHRVWFPTEEDVAQLPFDPRAPVAVVFGPAPRITALAREIMGFTMAALDRSARSLVALLVLGLGVVTAVLVALPTVLTDETFGSWQDYLAAFALGAASGAGAEGLFATWQRLTRHESVS